MKKFILQLLRDPQLYRYILVGGFAAVIDLGLFFLLREVLAIHYIIIATMSFVVATLINYILCNYVVFKFQQQRSAHSRFMLTYLVSAMGLIIHHSCLFVAFEFLALPLLISKLFGMGVAFSWNFLSRKYFVFKPVIAP